MSTLPRDDADELLRCADVLGAFGVTASDIGGDGSGDGLEEALAATLADGRDRTAVLRRTIARSDRGISCSARYARETLERELTGTFDAIGWSFAVERASPEDRLTLRATDHRGRQRETTVEYPATPLGSDNAPAVLRAINDSLLAGTDARFVLLSSGVDRWRAGLVDERELERLCDRYGPRIAAADRPLRPERGLEAYVPDGSTTGDEPWPAWAHGRERDANDATADVGSLVEEAETGDRGADDSRSSGDRTERGAESDVGPTSAQTVSSVRSESPSTQSSEADGFELCGSPTVSRVAGDADGPARDDADSSGSEPRRPDRSGSSARPGTSSDADRDSSTDGEGFGGLSGTTTATRVSNDSFGSDVEWETEDDRYRALGAALGAGGRVSVRGLLEDDDFLPELPATAARETRIEFADAFEPEAFREAKAAAEQSGFVWVDSGSLETTRVSNP